MPRPAGAGSGAAGLVRHGRRAMGRQHGRHREDPIEPLDGLLRALAQRLQRRPAGRVYLDREGDVTVLDLQAGDHSKADEVAPISIADGTQRAQDHLLGDGTHP